MSNVAASSIRREANRRYLLRIALRALVVIAITLFISHRFALFAVAIGLAAVALYTTSYLVRSRNEQASDFLMTLGDLPALVGVVHLPEHTLAFEAFVPVWLIGTTIANLRKGQPTFLPFYALTAWLILISHAPETRQPFGYAVVQTLTTAVAGTVALAVVLERRTHRTDALTGVLTRRAGLEELAQMGGRDDGLTLAFVDLRHFKAVNDDYGHAVGDEVLTVTAKRLQRSLRQGDVLFRYGGDEFIAASNAPDLEARLLKAFDEPVKTKSGPLKVSARIGTQHNAGPVDVDAVVHEADRRMYADARQSLLPEKAEIEVTGGLPVTS
ncbi:hypothetical protein BH24DEI2_BH24DEI2_00710 [soil metagenome]